MRVEGLFHLWDELREATDKKGHGLEEALSLMHFKRKIDNVQVLIGERVCTCTVYVVSIFIPDN